MGAGKGSFCYYRGVLICANIIGKYLGRQCKHLKIFFAASLHQHINMQSSLRYLKHLNALVRHCFCKSYSVRGLYYNLSPALMPGKASNGVPEVYTWWYGIRTPFEQQSLCLYKVTVVAGNASWSKTIFLIQVWMVLSYEAVLGCIWWHINVADTVHMREADSSKRFRHCVSPVMTQLRQPLP